jgi:hypothetical protein
MRKRHPDITASNLNQVLLITKQEKFMDLIASLTPIIVFGGLFIFAIYLGGQAMDTAASSRKLGGEK